MGPSITDAQQENRCPVWEQTSGRASYKRHRSPSSGYNIAPPHPASDATCTENGTDTLATAAGRAAHTCGAPRQQKAQRPGPESRPNPSWPQTTGSITSLGYGVLIWVYQPVLSRTG